MIAPIAPKFRVQEYIVLSGRYHVSQQSFDNLTDAFKEMRTRAIRCQSSFGTFDPVTNGFKCDATISVSESGQYITVQHGRAVRHFSIVQKRKGPAVPFTHLLKNRPT